MVFCFAFHTFHAIFLMQTFKPEKAEHCNGCHHSGPLGPCHSGRDEWHKPCGKVEHLGEKTMLQRKNDPVYPSGMDIAIHYVCPHCLKTVRVPPTPKEVSINCPYCKERFALVPILSENAAVTDSRTFRYDGTVALHNGDGLCYIDANGNFSGFRLNRAEGRQLYAASPQKLTPGIKLFRNSDIRFDTELARPTARRTIAVTLRFYELPTGFAIDISDGNTLTTHRCDTAKTPARAPQRERIKAELSKLGNTPFVATQVTVETSCDYFIPMSQLAEWRRTAISWFQTARRLAYRAPRRHTARTHNDVLSAQLDYRANVANATARDFYTAHGAQHIEPAFEITPVEEAELMRTRHCIRRYLGACLRTPQGKRLQGPLYLTYGNSRLGLHFDCQHCEMVIKKQP